MALQSKVGTFATATATGNQDVTSVGFQPDCLILWGAGSPTALDTVTASWRTFIGIADAPGSEYCISNASQDAASNSSHKASNVIIDIVQWAEAAAGKASLSAWLSNGFRLNWTTAPASAYEVHYLALQGVTAKALQWNFPLVSGNVSVTGAGFAPTCVLHIGENAITAGVTLGTAYANAGLSIGAQWSGTDWAIGAHVSDGKGTTEADHNGNTGLSYLCPGTATGGKTQFGMSAVSLDSDGFTVNVISNGTHNVPTVAVPAIALCLAGVQVAVGTLNKSTGGAPATSTVTGLAFQPTALIIGAHNGTSTTLGAATPQIGFGAVDSALGQAGMSIYATDNVAAASSASKSISTATYALSKITTTVAVSGSVTAYTSDGFTLTLNPNDASADLIGYLALAASASAVGSGRLSTLGAGR